MLVSAVLDPSAFDARYFDELYTIHAVDFLRGIERNGLLIVDSSGELQNDLRKRFTEEQNEYELIPIKYRLRLQKYVEELLLKKKSKRIILGPTVPSSTSSDNLLDLACDLKKDTTADILIIGDKDFEELKFNPKYRGHVFPLSKYRDSDFEKERQRYYNGLGPIDILSKPEVDELIIRSIRFSKWLRFYDGYIGKGDNTSDFREGIKYILSLWKEHSFFASRQNIGPVDIFTCNAERIWDDETDHAKKSKLERNQENYRKVIQELIDPLNSNKDFPWSIELSVKDDPDGIFHARYLETQHAIIRIDRGFDLFKQNGGFRRNFFTLNMAESPHLKECRELPDADLDNVF